MFALELLFGAGSCALLWLNFPMLVVWVTTKTTIKEDSDYSIVE